MDKRGRHWAGSVAFMVAGQESAATTPATFVDPIDLIWTRFAEIRDLADAAPRRGKVRLAQPTHKLPWSVNVNVQCSEREPRLCLMDNHAKCKGERSLSTLGVPLDDA